MTVHPVVLARTGATARELLGQLTPVWRRRLGAAACALEEASGPAPGGWLDALRELAREERRLQAFYSGYEVDGPVSIVWLAESHLPELEHELGALDAAERHVLACGREVRVHLLLLLPDWFVLPDTARQQALATLQQRLRSDPNAALPMRVWPLSARNRADLYLRAPHGLGPLVQHFVEALVLKEFPFHPVLPRGRDWAGVGVCHLESSLPSAEFVARRLWEVLKQSANTEAAEIPPCAQAPPSTVERVTLPKPESCDHLPPWFVEEHWKRFLHQEPVRYRNECERQAEKTNREVLDAAVQQALRGGVGAVDTLRQRLEARLQRAQAELNESVEEFDRAFGLEGVRGGAGPAVEGNGNRQNAELVREVDVALDTCDLGRFLGQDEEAIRAREQIDRTKRGYNRVVQRWTEEIDSAEQNQSPRPWWQRAWERVRAAVRWVFVPSPRQQEEGEDEKQQRAELCREAWQYVERAGQQMEVVARRADEWLQRWGTLVLRRAYRDALLRGIARCESIARCAESVFMDAGERCPARLTLQFHYPEQQLHTELCERAQRLLRQGVLDHLLSGNQRALERRLRDAASRFVAEVEVVPLARLLDAEAWRLAFDIAAPRAMIAHHPEQRPYNWLLGSVPPPATTEPLGVEEDWPLDPDREAVLFRFVHPIEPEQLLWESPAARGSDPATARGTGAPRRPRKGDDRRPNPLLEEAFYG